MAREHLLNIRKVLEGPAARLKNIKRFSNANRINQESVAEHSYYTAFYTLLIGRALATEVRFNMASALEKALIHDIEESHSGDFIRTFKHSSPEVRRAIDHAGAMFAAKIFKEIAPEGQDLDMLTAWELAKDDTLEGRVVRFADYLSVLAFLSAEARMGNWDIWKMCEGGIFEYQELFNTADFDFIKDLVAQARRLIEHYAVRSRKSA